MELYRRKPNGPWHVDLVDPNTGQRIRKTTGKTVKREAETAARRFLADLEAGDGKRPITLRAALTGYVTNLKTRRKSSVSEVEALVAKTLGDNVRMAGRHTLDGSRPIHALRPADLDALVTARTREGNAPQTIAHEIKTIRAACLLAADLGFRPADLKSWRLPAVTPKTRYLSPTEYRLVYDHLDPTRPIVQVRNGVEGASYCPSGRLGRYRRDAQDALVMLAMTGARWGEVAALTWDQIDLDAGIIRLFGSKTDQERLVGIPTALQSVLQRRKDRAGRGVPLVFPNASGGLRSGSCRAILRAMEAVGLNRADLVERYGRATVHSLRHTFASLSLQAGADLAEVQDALGHRTLQMTRRYAHLARGRTATKLAGLVGSSLGVVTPAELSPLLPKETEETS